MSFTSPVFLVFLPLVIMLYRLIPKKGHAPLLLVASLFFYAYYDVRLLALIIFTVLFSYSTGLYMSRTENTKKRTFAFILTLLECIGILFFFKYFNFAVGSAFSLLRLFNSNASFQALDIVLPMGISFYIFQNMAYSIDVYKNKYKAETNLIYYALFISFFPQLVAGPIERPDHMLPQLKNTQLPTKKEYSIGFQFLLRGYAKKVLIADTVSTYVNTAYSNVSDAGGASLLIATILFAIQIYCDFSGYCDIALGCAHFLGIQLSDNFNRPYKAISIRDFWSRWHITLTSWFRDYLYIPLGGNRKGLFLQCFNMLFVFIVSGLWHGANFTFLIWGGIHGSFLVIETLLFRKRTFSKKWDIPRRMMTFAFVCFAWIFFRATSISDVSIILSSIFTNFLPQNMLVGLGASITEFLILILLLLLLPFLEKLPALGVLNKDKFMNDLSCQEKSQFHKIWYNVEIRNLFLYFILFFALMIGRILLLTSNGSSEFIYFEF